MTKAKDIKEAEEGIVKSDFNVKEAYVYKRMADNRLAYFIGALKRMTQYKMSNENYFLYKIRQNSNIFLPLAELW